MGLPWCTQRDIKSTAMIKVTPPLPRRFLPAQPTPHKGEGIAFQKESLAAGGGRGSAATSPHESLNHWTTREVPHPALWIVKLMATHT